MESRRSRRLVRDGVSGRGGLVACRESACGVGGGGSRQADRGSGTAAAPPVVALEVPETPRTGGQGGSWIRQVALDGSGPWPEADERGRLGISRCVLRTLAEGRRRGT